ncbi:unnamed protein product [Clonostachys rosea]|uniref:ABC-2 type transporter transmembrane domain-containing protein n=1 Tax=Bionectria ochroleuca TaxID=29856 RepID=A0ABY6V0I6_BIOOC|nr:unnamed protein product [Clonostachys rosea]
MFTCINRVTIPHFFTGRSLFEAREYHSKTHHWSVFIGANVLLEFFWQTLVSAPVFVAWYYPIGLAANGDASLSTAERGGASFVLIWLFVLWAFSALFDHVDMAMDISVLFYWLVLVLCGVLATPDQLPKF